MGGGNKKQNQMQQQYTNDMGGRSSGEYGYRTDTRSYLTDQYKKLYEGVGADAGTGGGGGGGGEPAWVDPATGMRQSVYDQYKNLADTGGWTDPEMANYRSWTTAPISGFYTGMRNDLQRRNNAIGGYAGYNSQSAKLLRDASRQGYLTAQESESGLQQMIRDAKLKGIEGMANEAEAISSASRPRGGGGGGGGGGSSDDDKRDYYLRQMTGLMNGSEDLPYAQLQGQSLNAQKGDPGESKFNKGMKIAAVAAPVIIAI